jgi:pseudouridine-5'-phosphate glycosidase
MKLNLPLSFHVSEEVARALQLRKPVVALESTVITHGLPYPDNLKLALDMESDVRDCGAIPATIALVDGSVQVGVQPEQLERLARAEGMHKISVRDFGPAIAKGWSGGTTVAGTLLAAKKTGMRVFATGGIGGVHRGVGAPNSQSSDISADLPMLAKTPMIVVCAGAKAILDLPATLEYLETYSIPVVGYQTDEFPAFYSRSSGMRTSYRVDSLAELVDLSHAHWGLGLKSALLVVNPPPEAIALSFESVEVAIQRALREAQAQNVRGQQVTPFLLSRVSELTGRASLEANLGLLRNNARLAAMIALELAKCEATEV